LLDAREYLYTTCEVAIAFTGLVQTLVGTVEIKTSS
jgi:hypothetical protein